MEALNDLEPCFYQVNSLIDDERIPTKQKIIWVYRYRNFMSWDKISKKLELDKRHCIRLHGYAIAILAGID